MYKKKENIIGKMRNTLFRFAIQIALWLGASHFAFASENVANYEVKLREIPLGDLTLKHQQDPNAYSVTMSFRTKGLADALFRLHIDGVSTGEGIEFGRPFPQSASYTFTADGETQKYNLIFRDGVLTESTYEPSLRSTIEAASQKDALDPLSAFLLIMRQMPGEQLCKFSVRTFDGLKANRITLGTPTERVDGRIQCNGGIELLHGYDTDQTPTSYFFTALYRYNRNTGLYEVERLVGQSPYGQYQILNR